MELEILSYNLMHTRPIVGYGNFTKEYDPKTSCMIDTTIVDKKFDLWKKNITGSHNAHYLLKDKSIFAYAHLKYDGIPVKMRWMQDVILSDDHDRILFCGCNQYIGKSFTLNIDAATEFLMDHGKNWVGLLVSGSLPQSQYQMDRIKMLLKGSDILNYREEDTIETKTGKKDNSTQISLTFYEDDQRTPRYTNLLICCPHTSSALGYPANNLWLDEFEFWDNCDQRRFLYQIVIPRTFKTKGKVKIYTNPDGKEKMMYELWNQYSKDGEPAWHRYQFNYWDNEEASQKGFDKASIGMSRVEIESTLLAVFSKSEGSFFSTDEIKDMLNDEELKQKGDSAGYGRETAWFLDIGVVHDQSCLVGGYTKENPEVPEIPLIDAFYIHKYPVGYPLARVVGITSAIDEEDGWQDYAEDNHSVKEILARYEDDNVSPIFGFDATGNAGALPLFHAIGIEAFDIIFSGKKKWHMYQRYQYYVQKRFIKRSMDRDDNTVRGCDFSSQAQKLVVKKTKGTSSYKQIHHEDERDLDDTQDAIAGMIHLIENPDLPTLSFKIIPHPGSPQTKEAQFAEAEKDPKLKGQYIPSWMDEGEMLNWIEKRESQYR